ncbi:HD domain-containing protein [Halanaerobacter jeridensis]|uniref:Nucleotidyltransferase with HDIG domain n=1 Tax=Halanaerobacter jeridensis TaxID=706427 RepID=A0A939BQP7_9FIRM|nr:HD domain-containing protein [Halanaerobacter jeridensis]MBM7556569.1 putative nucleotidyltransferase with HDIG domain [Halanaerobacter jeridensis]
MNQQLLFNIQEQFDNYVSQFSLSDPEEQQNIDLKYQHSYQVCNKMKKIIDDMLEGKEAYIAQTIALLHDIGRFKQYQEYKTFADAKSEDHAQLGVSVIKDNDLLATVDPINRELILKAIQYHNKPYLPENESEECLLYTKLIRDADKLDIWRVVLKEYTNQSDNNTVNLGLSTAEKISDAVYQQIMAEEVVKYEDLETISDFKLLQMGWVFDINFGPSFTIIKEKEYIDRLYDTLPKTPATKEIYSKINSYLEQQSR